MQISNNTVLVTGGGSGIGLALAHELVHSGNKVIICGRDEEKLSAARHEMPDLATRRCDLTRRSDREGLVAWTVDRFPRLNVLINNAGILSPIDLSRDAFDFDRVEQEFLADLYAPVELTLRFLPHLRRQRHAAVVNVSTGQVYSPAGAGRCIPRPSPASTPGRKPCASSCAVRP